MSLPSARSIWSTSSQPISFSFINTPLTMSHKVMGLKTTLMKVHDVHIEIMRLRQCWNSLLATALYANSNHATQFTARCRDEGRNVCVRGFSIFCWTTCGFDIHMSMHRNIIPSYSQRGATFLVLFISTRALHVSGGSSAHHQEHITVHTVSGIASYRGAGKSSARPGRKQATTTKL